MSPQAKLVAGLGLLLEMRDRSGRSHYLQYTANWRRDMAMGMSYADLKVFGQDGLEGRATYDARNGGGRMDKFGAARSKIEPLIGELFGGLGVKKLNKVSRKQV